MNEEEAERVRAIFALFEQHRSLLLTLMEIERRGCRLKSWTRKTGQFRSGGPFALNSLRRLLTNVLYTGTIQHKGQPYPGEHEAILAPGTWERVQDLITQRYYSCARQDTEQTFGFARAKFDMATSHSCGFQDPGAFTRTSAVVLCKPSISAVAGH